MFSLLISKLFMAYLLAGKKFLAFTLRSSHEDASTPTFFVELQYHSDPSDEQENKLSHEKGWKQTSSTGSECVWHMMKGFFWLLTSYTHSMPFVLPHATKYRWFGWLARHVTGAHSLSSIRVIAAFFLSRQRVSHSLILPRESATAISNCFKYSTLLRLHNWL